MTDLLKELLSYYKEKTKLPIVSTYIILLIVWNWDILSVYLFSSVNMETRICWIKNIVPGFWDHLCRIIFPATISFAYPFITNNLMYYTDKWLNKSIEDRTRILNERRVSKAKAKFRIKEEELGTSDLKQLEVQIKELEGKRDSLTVSLESANNLNKDLSSRLKKASDIYADQKTEFDALRNENEKLKIEKDRIESTFTNLNYSISKPDEYIILLAAKYLDRMSHWESDKLSIFLNLRKGLYLTPEDINVFSKAEFEGFIKDEIFEKIGKDDKQILVVSTIGENLSSYLRYKKNSL